MLKIGKFFKLFVLALTMATPFIHQSWAGPLQISSDGHYFVRDGRPFKIVGDTGWFVFGRRGASGFNSYVRTRASQGFTTIMATTMNNVPPGPFSGGTDITRPNDAYFNSLKSSIDYANSLGLVVMMTPSWFAVYGNNWFLPLAQHSTENLTNYGRYLGNKFKSCENLVWIMGGDGHHNLPTVNGVRGQAQAIRIVDAIAAGINSVDPSKLTTYHPTSHHASFELFQNRSWLDFNMVQDGSKDGNDLRKHMINGYKLSPSKPMLMGEAAYEWREDYTLFTVRRHTIWGWFFGGPGTVFGNSSTFGSGGSTNTPGATQMTYLSRFMDQQSWSTLKPDFNGAVMTVENSHVGRLINSTGTRALAYLPGKMNVTVSMGFFKGPVNAQWWDPQNGTYSVIAGSPFPNSGSRRFDATFGSDQDRVLVLTSGGVTPEPLPDTQKPTIPGSVKAVAQSTSAITVSWTASTDNKTVTGYDVYRGTTKVGTTTSLSFTNTGLAAGTLYSFKVQARDAAGNLSDFSAVANATTPTVTVPDTQKPTIPGSVRAVAQSSSAIVVSWTASTDNIGVSGYDVYRGTTKVATTTALSFTNTGLAANTTYSFKVQARDAAGNLSDFSAITNATTQSGTVPPPSVVYQAESAVVVGAQKHSTYVDYINNSGDYIEWTVTVPTAGTYKLGFRYAHGISNRPLEIKVNSKVVVASLSFPGTGSTSNYQTVTTSATLTAGINKIRATAIGNSGGNMDSLTVTKQ